MQSNTTGSHAYSELAKPDTNNATYIGWNGWENDCDWSADFHPINKKDFYELLDRINVDDLLEKIRTELKIDQRQFEKCYGKVAHRIQSEEIQKKEFDKYQLDDAMQFQWRSSGDDKDDGWL